MKKFALLVLLTLLLTAFGQVSSNEAEKDLDKLAFSYGAQAFDMLDIAERMLQNQKVTTILYAGLAEIKDLKVEILNKAITRIESRTWWQKLWAWIRGPIIGAGVVLIVMSI